MKTGNTKDKVYFNSAIVPPTGLAPLHSGGQIVIGLYNFKNKVVVVVLANKPLTSTVTI